MAVYQMTMVVYQMTSYMTYMTKYMVVYQMTSYMVVYHQMTSYALSITISPVYHMTSYMVVYIPCLSDDKLLYLLSISPVYQMTSYPLCHHIPCLSPYPLASASRIDNIIGLFCKRALYKKQHSAKKTYNCIDPTDRSHPICICT